VLEIEVPRGERLNASADDAEIGSTPFNRVAPADQDFFDAAPPFALLF
jgi:hypothetical protein